VVQRESSRQVRLAQGQHAFQALPGANQNVSAVQAAAVQAADATVAAVRAAVSHTVNLNIADIRHGLACSPMVTNVTVMRRTNSLSPVLLQSSPVLSQSSVLFQSSPVLFQSSPVLSLLAPSQFRRGPRLRPADASAVFSGRTSRMTDSRATGRAGTKLGQYSSSRSAHSDVRLTKCSKRGLLVLWNQSRVLSVADLDTPNLSPAPQPIIPQRGESL
jgi:hypothetical protein